MTTHLPKNVHYGREEMSTLCGKTIPTIVAVDAWGQRKSSNASTSWKKINCADCLDRLWLKRHLEQNQIQEKLRRLRGHQYAQPAAMGAPFDP